MRVLILSILILLLSACGSGGADEGGHGVLVITIDALRVDHLGIAGYDRKTTPTLDALAEKGVFFSEAFSAAPERIPAHAALLSGCDPTLARRPRLQDGSFGVLPRFWHLPQELPSLARAFLANGYATAAFVDHPWLSAQLGLNHGFEQFFGYQQGIEPGESPSGIEAGSRRFLRWLRSVGRKKNWFAYITIDDLESDWGGRDPIWSTYFEPRAELTHVPPVGSSTRMFFAIPRHVWTGGTSSIGEYEARYDGRLRRLDEQLRLLFGQLKTMDRLHETTICVVGTFGLGFGESGLVLDHGTLSDVDLHVPWILVPPRSFDAERGAVIDRLASTIDVAPTLLEIVNLQVPDGMHGVSQIDALRGGTQPVREYAFATGGVHAGFAVRTEDYSYESIRPGGAGPSPLEHSFYGERRSVRRAQREHLRDRSDGSGPGDLEPSLELPEVADELRAAGTEWIHWVELARDALHRLPWASDPVDPIVLDELKSRGLIPRGIGVQAD